MNTYSGLVLSGPCDGERHVCEQPYLDVFRHRPTAPSFRLSRSPASAGNATLEIDTVRYHHEQITTPGRTWGFWVPDGWTTDDVLDRLNDGYRAIP